MRIFIAMLAFAALFANASDMKDAAYKSVESSRAKLDDFRKSPKRNRSSTPYRKK